jgi:chromosome partitioning protein
MSEGAVDGRARTDGTEDRADGAAAREREGEGARAVSVALQKGGVGKTTLAINLAERLSARGDDVLLVDLDGQGNATEGVGLADAYDADRHLGHLLGDGPAELEEVVRETEWFDVVPANRDYDDVADRIRTTTFAETWVRDDVVDPALEEYDRVVLDTPPALGALSDASLVASGNVVVPLRMSEPSVSGFERMVERQVVPLRRQVPVEVLAIVPNALEGDNEERRILGDLESSPFADRLPAFARTDEFEDPDSPGPGIRKRVAFKRAYREGVPLAAYDPTCDVLDRLDAVAGVVQRGGVDE